MPDQNDSHPADKDLGLIAEDMFASLAAQFPTCMASDEFHFFPQATATALNGSPWDEFSPTAISATLERMTQWENGIERYASSPSPSAQTIDAAMLLRVIRTLREQLGLVRAHETQPTFYLTIVGIGLAEAFENGLPSFETRLRHLPDFLDQARRNLIHIPRLFRDMGTEMLERQQKWLDTLSLPEAHRLAVNKAYERLDLHLRKDGSGEEFLPSVELYERIAFSHMGCFLNPEQIAKEFEQEIAETRNILSQSAAELAPGVPWQSVVDGLPLPQIPPGGVGEIYQNTISELARHCSAQGLFSSDLLQTCPVEVKRIPDYMRPVRSNAAFSMPPIHPPRGGTFFIEETGKGASLPTDYRLLTAHETFPGHHLLDTCRWRHRRPIRRHIEFPIFYEGWASFSEELLFDTGFFSGPADRLLMAKRRFWRAMRGQVDFDIHMRGRTPEQAAEDLASEGLPPQRAMAMVRRFSLKPGYQLAYTIGRRRFRALYDIICPDRSDPVSFARQVLEQGEIGFNHLERLFLQGG